VTSGDRLLLDTNAIIALLRGHAALLGRLHKADWVGISILSQIEFLAFPGLSEMDKGYFSEFLTRVEVIGLDRAQHQLIDRIIQVRQRHRLKLPDAIVVATALECSAFLVTDDKKLGGIPPLRCVTLA